MNKIAVLSNVTIDLITLRLKKNFTVYIPEGFNTWQQEVFNPDSNLYPFLPDAVYIILYADFYDEEWQDRKRGNERIKNWLEALKFLSDKMAEIPIFVSSLDIPGRLCSTPSESNYAVQMEARWIRNIEKLHNAYILPLKEEVVHLGRKNFYLPKMWYLGNAPYSLKASEAIAEQINRCFFYAKGSKKKCFAVDLDNTLWGGVIGEDGIDGIVLASHKEGSRYYDTQKCLKRMKENGVMLVAVSKNNLEDVKQVFSSPFMLLKEEDFVSWKINWQSKPQNIKELAEELNIGLDAFVFLDDNPAEREQMKEQCAEVEVLDFPQDTTLLPKTVENAYELFFKSLYTTDEDREKTEKYRRQSKRTALKKDALSVENYLCRLEITADIHLMKQSEKKRVVQLAGKTNQFNTTTIRYDEKQIGELQGNEHADIVVAYMKDKFGDEGLTAVIVIMYKKETAIIESFMMSCRVMGRQFENVIINVLVERIRTVHPEIKRLQAEYIKTAKNKPVEMLYDLFGFHVSETTGKETEIGYIKRYEAEIEDIHHFVNPYKKVYAFEKEG